MILYISSYKNNEIIIETINEAQQNIVNQIIDERFNLHMYVKQQLEQLQAVNILIIDLFALSDSEDEILQSLNSLRLLYSNIRIIILAPNRVVGDHLLSEIFCLGIYDIIPVIQEDTYLAKKELLHSINTGKEYKDCVKFKLTTVTTDTKLLKTMKEKIIIKNEVRQSVNKALIGFVGTQERIGVTHNAIVSANYLKSKGYKVAIVENSLNPRKCFSTIQESFENLENATEEYFTLNHVDYYSDYSFEEVHKILAKNYNFVILDFGEFNNDLIAEFNRCVVQIIVSGSKPWEIKFISKIFECTQEVDLKHYSYLFNFTDLENANSIRENMDILDKVFFTGYTPDPFNSKFYSDLDKLFQEYLTETTVKEIKESILKELLKKIQWYYLNLRRKKD